MSKIPLRMCIVCRKMRPKAELLKIVKSTDGELAIDTSGKLPGRGAYICTDGDCGSRLEKTKALERAFKCSVHKELKETIMKELI